MTKLNRRTFLKRTIASALGVFGIGGGTYYYAKYIEPALLTIREEKISSPIIPNTFNGFKILQITDTHLGFHYSLEQFKKLVVKANALKPNIILFTGDLVDAPHTYSSFEYDKTIQILSSLKASNGKFWIYGNHDHGGYGTEKSKKVMELGGFTLLRNSHTYITINESNIVLAGLDDVMLGKPDIKRTLSGINPTFFTLLMCHEPDYAEQVKEYPVDVQLSGHSHGGQVRIPFVGHLITPPFAEKYVEGRHLLGTRPLTLYVSKGIGTTRLPYRFLCRPELNLYTLENLA